MRSFAVLSFLGGLWCLGGCAGPGQQVDTARVTPPAFGSNGDIDIAAINLSSWAFGRAANTHDHPVDAARALEAVDYLAGALSSSPRWAGMSPLTKLQMLAARREVRDLLGIPIDTPSQAVVDALHRVAEAYASQEPAAIQAALQNPVFGKPPGQLSQLFNDLPFLGTVNIATQNASAGAGSGEGSCRFCN
jgi:hypothetical protein